ncbi:hypothetical protein EYF80_020986 [Liparis tanakae]|uniref:Uncharacterized protein n=1 Tax=Liparis tanakae TaxID=230148 RepID=A0A4Z2HSR1_9TELE|nr:hypothetical protein EYF80_020986 [Liparis tanakae]
MRLDLREDTATLGGVEAAVHALLVPGDSAFDGDAARSRAQDELLRVDPVHQRALGAGRPGGHQLLGTTRRDYSGSRIGFPALAAAFTALLTGMSLPLAAEAGLVLPALGDRERERSSSASSSRSLSSSKFMLPDRPGETEVAMV